LGSGGRPPTARDVEGVKLAGIANLIARSTDWLKAGSFRLPQLDATITGVETAVAEAGHDRLQYPPLSEFALSCL